MKSRRPRRAAPMPIGGTIGRVLADLGHGSAATVMQIGASWPELVGPEAAAHSEPAALRGAQLEITTDSSVWCQQLQMRRDAILAALREAFGDRAPTDLRLRVG